MSMADLMKRFGITHRGMVELARSFDPDGDVFKDEELEQLFRPADPADLAEETRREKTPRPESVAGGRPAGPTGAEISGRNRRSTWMPQTLGITVETGLHEFDLAGEVDDQVRHYDVDDPNAPRLTPESRRRRPRSVPAGKRRRR